MCASRHVRIFDVETSGLWPWLGHHICGYGFRVLAGCGKEQPPAQYVPFRHTSPDQPTLDGWVDPRQTSEEEALARMREFCDDPNGVLVGHNLKFELNMLRAEGIEVRGKLWDTMVGAFLMNENEPSYALKSLGSKYLKEGAADEQDKLIEYMRSHRLKDSQGWRYDWVPPQVMEPYAIQDILLTEGLYWMQMAELSKDPALTDVAVTDMELIRVLADMEWCGVKIDLERCITYGRECQGRLMEITEELQRLVGRRFEPGSTKAVAQELLRRGIKTRFETKTGGPSTSEKSLEQAKGDKFVDLMLAYRSWQKAQAFYTSFLELADYHGYIHPQLNQVSYVTGRMACSRPNLQGLPQPDGIHKIRDVVVPEEGTALWSFDYSQMELRVVANYAGETAMIKAFEQGEDIHQVTADLMSVSRFDAKRVNFGMLYGSGAQGLANEWNIDRKRAGDLLQRHRQAYPKLRGLANHAGRVGTQRGYIRYWSGRVRHTKGLESHKVLQTLISGGCADVMRQVMVRVHHMLQGTGARMLTQVHDELLVQIPYGQEEDLVPAIVEVMEDFDYFDLAPLKVDVAVAKDSWMNKEEWHGAN